MIILQLTGMVQDAWQYWAAVIERKQHPNVEVVTKETSTSIASIDPMNTTAASTNKYGIKA